MAPSAWPTSCGCKVSEEQIQLLERHSTDFRCRHVEVSAPGELLNQDTFYWGTLKGVGKVYVQVVVDVFCSLAFAKVYNSKMPVSGRTPAQALREALGRDELPPLYPVLLEEDTELAPEAA